MTDPQTLSAEYALILLSQGPDGIVAFDRECRYTLWNPAMERITGIPADEVLGRCALEVFPFNRDTGEECFFREALAGRAAVSRDRPYCIPSTERAGFFDAQYLPVRSASGEVIGGMAVIRDVSDRHLLEEQWQWLVMHARCLLWSADVWDTGHPKYFAWDQNFPEQAAQQFMPLELEPGESYKDAWYRCRDAEDRDRCDELAARAIRAGQDYEQEFRISCAVGGPRWVREDIRVQTVEPGRRWRVIAVATDITERRLADQAIRDASERKDEFMAMLAHELRNPLGAVKNALHVMQQVPADGTAFQRAHERALRQVEHQTRLVNELLDAARVGRGKLELRTEPLDFCRQVRETAADYAYRLAEAGIRFEVQAAEEPLTVCGDRDRLAQIVGNLLDNAAKFTPAGGTVTVSVERSGGAIILRVADTGAGIAQELLARVFEPFTQGDRVVEDAQAGLGLGLALVRGLAQLHGGDVAVRSDGLGRGAEFTVKLPLAAGSPIDGGEADPEPQGQGVRVLVIEDNPDAAETLRDLLEMFGHQVAVASTGPNGIAAAHAFGPDVVLCDIGLPGLSGYEVAAELKRSPATSGIRLVAVTGYGGREDRVRSLEAGFEAHLTKPVDLDELRTLLSKRRV